MGSLTEQRLSTSVGTQSVWRGGPAGGPPLVYLHAASGESPGAAVLEELADTHQVLAPMFPGFGDSEGIELIDDIEDAVWHLLDLWAGLGLAAPAVVGASLGGWMAAELAMRYPSAVGHLILVNPGGLYLEGHPIKEIFGRPPGDLADDLFADQSQPMAQLMHQLQAILEARAEIPFELLKPTLMALGATAKVGWSPYLHDPKLFGRLNRISAPTLVVHGAEDRLIPRQHAVAYAGGIAGARLVDVEGAGHLLPLERPAELAALIREFVPAR